MAKSYNQKAKILYLERMLNETTPQTPISMQVILMKLGEVGIRAERKSIYDDMETLREFGMDIQYRRGREGGYFITQPEPAMDKAPDTKSADASADAASEGSTGSSEAAAMQSSETADGAKENIVDLRPQAPTLDKQGKEIKLLCRNSLKKEILAAVGEDAPCKAKGEECFSVIIQTQPDRKFYGWLASMGRSIRIVKPKKVAAAYREFLKNIAKDYKSDK